MALACRRIATARCFIGRRIDGFEVCIERRLHVDDQVAAVRHVDDHVGTQVAVLDAHVHLFLEVAVLDHARQFGEPTQSHFAPLAAHFRTAQRVHQRASFFLQRRLAERDRFERALQAAEGFGAFLFDAQDLLLGLAERFANRRRAWSRSLSRARLRARDRRLLMLAEMFARELQEQFAIGAQRAVGDGIERRLQPLDRAFERRLTFAFQLFFAFELRFEHGDFDVQRLRALPCAQRRDQRSQQHGPTTSGSQDDQPNPFTQSPAQCPFVRCIM